MACGKRKLLGKVYRSKKWAKRWAHSSGYHIRKVKGGWKIVK